MKTRTKAQLFSLALILIVAVAFFAFAQTNNDDPVIIRIGNQTETLSVFNERFEIAIRGVAASQGAPLTDEIRASLVALKPQYLDQRVTEFVLMNEANSRDITAPQEDIDAQITQIKDSVQEGETFEGLLAEAGFTSEAQLRQYIAESYIQEDLITQLRNEISFTDEQLKVRYQAEKAQFQRPEQVCARHILVETVDEANTVLAELESGGDFAELAAQYSIGPTGPDGGDLGCFEQAMMVAPFAEAAFAADVDAPVGPVETQFGQHVILVYDRLAAGEIPFEEVRDQLEEQMRQEAFTNNINALIDNSGVKSYPERLDTAEPVMDDGAMNDSTMDDDAHDDTHDHNHEDMDDTSEDTQTN